MTPIGRRSCEILINEKTPLSHVFVCFQMLDFETSNLRSRNQIREKLCLCRKLHYFRGSRFSQCFILSTSPHNSLPSEVLCPRAPTPLRRYIIQSFIHFVLKPLYSFGTEKKSSQIYKKITGFTEGNGERLLLKCCSMKCFTF